VWLKDQVRGADSDKELKKMWNQFSRRTSAECCEMVRETLTPDFLAQVEMAIERKRLDPNFADKVERGDNQAVKDEQAIKTANELVAKVKIANGRQLVKHAILLTIAVLGILAVIGSIKFTGPLAAALFVIGALLWLLVDSRMLHRVAAKTFYPDLGCSKKDVWKNEWVDFVRTTKKVSACFQSYLPAFKLKTPQAMRA
jgi:hypothetical protein